MFVAHFISIVDLHNDHFLHTSISRFFCTSYIHRHWLPILKFCFFIVCFFPSYQAKYLNLLASSCFTFLYPPFVYIPFFLSPDKIILHLSSDNRIKITSNNQHDALIYLWMIHFIGVLTQGVFRYHYVRNMHRWLLLVSYVYYSQTDHLCWLWET